MAVLMPHPHTPTLTHLLFPALFLLVKNVFQTATHDGRGFEVLFQCIQFVLLAVKFFLKTSLYGKIATTIMPIL